MSRSPKIIVIGAGIGGLTAATLLAQAGDDVMVLEAGNSRLTINWREGEQHVMRWLVDGDLAANNGGWQWSAGAGTDVQPYFRLFNPVLQGRKFDPDGIYIRRWIPELRSVASDYVHAPWEMARPPSNCPPPIVDHGLARQRVIEAFRKVRLRSNQLVKNLPSYIRNTIMVNRDQSWT